MKFYYSLIFIFFLLRLSAQTTTLFEDNFETSQTWSIFEELVSNHPCYAVAIGEVVRSTDHAQTGTNALRVWANKNQTVKSNHVIGSHIVYPAQGITGRLRYCTWAYAASTIGLTQSGPEISVQNTRTVNGVNYTYIAGIQFIGNQWLIDKWNIWHNGTWAAIKPSEINANIATNTWYYIELEFDFTTNEYISLKIQGGSINLNLDLRQAFTNAPLGFKIGAEARSWQPSLFVTAESENLWTTCSQVYENKVYYDNVSLKQVQTTLPVEIVDFRGDTEGGKNRLFWAIKSNKQIQNIDIERSENGRVFEKIGSVSPSQYQFVDEMLALQNCYYRLKINNKDLIDNQYVYSKTITIQRSFTTKAALKVYPHIATKDITITYENAAALEEVQIVDIYGRVWLSEKLLNKQNTEGGYLNNFNISRLPSSVYFVILKTQKMILTERFVKQ